MIRAGLSGEGAAPNDVTYHDDRLKPKTMVLGLDVEGASKAFPLEALRQVRVVNDLLGGKPVLVVHQPTSDTTTAFVARSGGKTLTFEAANAEASALVDRQTDSRWNAYGECVSGRLKGSTLEALVLEPEYWFAWSEFHRETARLRAAAPLTGGSLRRQRRAFLREDHREELRGLRLARVLRDFVRRTGLFVEHLPGRVRLFLALPRDLGDDGALEDIGQHEARMVMHRADTSGRVVDVADRHFPVVHRHIRQVVLEDWRTRGGRRGGRCGLRLRLSETAGRDELG